MVNEIPEPPFIYEGVDPVAEPTVTETVTRAAQAVGDTLQRAGSSVGETWDNAKKPGMPLSVIGNVAREAPLASLLVAFLLGVAFARRR